MKSLSIKDTTRDEREKIVKQSLNACGGSCDGCDSCDSVGGGTVDSIYKPYIDGKMEIREINESYNSPNVR